MDLQPNAVERVAGRSDRNILIEIQMCKSYRDSYRKLKPADHPASLPSSHMIMYWRSQAKFGLVRSVTCYSAGRRTYAHIDSTTTKYLFSYQIEENIERYLVDNTCNVY